MMNAFEIEAHLHAVGTPAPVQPEPDQKSQETLIEEILEAAGLEPLN